LKFKTGDIIVWKQHTSGRVFLYIGVLMSKSRTYNVRLVVQIGRASRKKFENLLYSARRKPEVMGTNINYQGFAHIDSWPQLKPYARRTTPRKKISIIQDIFDLMG